MCNQMVSYYTKLTQILTILKIKNVVILYVNATEWLQVYQRTINMC